ncbi:hypothetical protein Lal_00049895 [Lupinus albus]|nr:hypothetical protein Lal_00049895 [Lupinus albus]
MLQHLELNFGIAILNKIIMDRINVTNYFKDSLGPFVMEPLPHAIHPNYKPANKLQVIFNDNGLGVYIGKGGIGDSGIGRAVCLSFAKEGATVAFTYVKGHEDKDKDDTLKMLLDAKTSGAQENCKKVIDVLVNNAAEQHLPIAAGGMIVNT